MFGATVLVLLIPLARASWPLLAGLGTAVVVTLGLAALLPVVARAASSRLAIGVAAVVVVVAAGAAAVLAFTVPSAGLVGIAVIAIGVVLPRGVTTITERTLGAGALATVAGALGAVGYALTVSLALVGGTTASPAVALGLGVVVGLGEGVLGGRLLRGELPVD